jgi:hypothetical protein
MVRQKFSPVLQTSISPTETVKGVIAGYKTIKFPECYATIED